MQTFPMRLRIIQTGIFFLLAHSVTVSEAEAGEFEELRSRYQEKRLEVDLASKKEKEALLQQYAAAVTQVQEKIQAAGDLDGVVATRTEIDAAKAGELHDYGDAAVPGSLTGVRKVAEEALEKILSSRNVEIEALDLKYIEALKNVQTSLTKAGKLEEAVAVLEEIERISSVEREVDTSALEFSDLPDSLRGGLTAWFPFDANEEKEVLDISPEKMVGALRGTSHLEEGKIGGARYFNGENDRIELGKQIPDSERFSVSAWVKYEGTPGRGAIFSDFDGKNANDLMFSIATMESIHIRADKSGDKLRAVVPLTKPLTTEWHHIVWTLNSRESLLYVDGGKVGEYREKGCNKGYHNAFIGYGNIGGGWSHFHGAIDEFMIWDRALDEDEVKELCKLMIR